MISRDRSACAAGFLRREQEKGEARSGTTGEFFDERTLQEPPALRVAREARARGVAALDRMTRCALRAAPGGSSRPRATQTIPSREIML